MTSITVQRGHEQRDMAISRATTGADVMNFINTTWPPVERDRSESRWMMVVMFGDFLVAPGQKLTDFNITTGDVLRGKIVRNDRTEAPDSDAESINSESSIDADEMKQLLAERKECIETQDSRIDELVAHIAMQDGRIQELMHRLDEQQDEIDSLNEEVAELKGKLEMRK